MTRFSNLSHTVSAWVVIHRPRVLRPLKVNSRAKKSHFGIIKRMSKTSNKDLLNALTPYAQNTPLLDLIANSLGFTTFREFSMLSTSSLRSFLLEATDDLFTLWLLEENRVILFQSTRLAQSLAVSIPISRVRRVVNEVDTTSYTIRLEIEADRVLTNGTFEKDGDGFLIASATLNASYTLSGPLERYPLVLPFYIALNSALI